MLGSTLERVALPDDLVARLEGKSSFGRLGLLIHSTAGFIDPGFDGHVTLELSNVANLPITIYHGMKIGQISFMQLSERDVDAVRRVVARVEVPGTARPDTVALLAELRGEHGRRMKVLVTGGTGFVGPKVVRALREQGHEVRALVRQPDRAAQLAGWGAELVTGDVTDPASLRAAAVGCTHVVHLVAILKGSESDFHRVMTQGTADLLAAAKDAGVQRFVLMSALGTSEETKDTVPYFASKWAMEQATIGSGLEYTIFRPSFVFGPGGGALPTFVKQVRYSPLVTVIGSGLQRIQPIYVEDVAQYFAAGLDDPRAVEPDVRDRRPGRRDVERAVPRDRKGAGKAPPARAHPVERRPRRRAAHSVGTRRAADHRPDRDDRSRRQRRHEHRCRRHLPAPARPARRADPALRLSGGSRCSCCSSPRTSA